MSKVVYITERIGHFSPADTLAGAIEQWAHSQEIVALCEPTDVIIRRRYDGIPYLFHAKQVEIKYRFTRRSQWRYDILTFNMDDGELEA